MICLEKIGKGGYSEVWLYEKHHPKQKVAVKVLSAEVLSEAQRRQFEDEANLLAEMDHPNIVQVYGAGTTGDGRPYLVMKYYPPPDLGERVATKAMTVPEALRTGVQLASAVETAHLAGVIHRDIKPANVLVDQYGDPALIDFGIAGRGDLSEGGDDLGVSMPWSPPEVLSGKSNGSRTSDVYSLAATVWHLLVGHSPFAVAEDRKGHEQFKQILHARRPATGRAEVPSSLDRLLQQAMAIEPNQRPQTAIDFARHLNRIEQELRFDRTKIVVPERPAAADPAPPAPATRATGSPDAFAPPRQVVAPPAAAPPVDSPVPVAEVDESATMLQRPKRPQPAPPPPGKAFARSSRVAAESSVGSTDLTGRRPAAPSPVEPSPSEPPSPGGRRGLVAGGVVGLLVLLVVAIGIGLANHGGDPHTPALPEPTSPSDIGDVVDGFDALSPPEITVVAQGDVITFSASPEEAEDVFIWRARTGSGDFHKVTPNPDGRSVTISGAKKACVELRVRRDSAGALSDAAEKCWP
jgi:serine/threonine protein kinase